MFMYLDIKSNNEKNFLRQDFISRNGQFSINIGLCESNQPVLGVIILPGLDVPKIYYAAHGHGAYVQVGFESLPIRILVPTINSREELNADTTSSRSTSFHDNNNINNDNYNIKDIDNNDIIRIVLSPSHNSTTITNFINKNYKLYKPITNMKGILRLLAVAEGVADIFPWFSPTSEWEICAAHAILYEADANIYIAEEKINNINDNYNESDNEYKKYLNQIEFCITENTFIYNKPVPLNPSFVVMSTSLHSKYQNIKIQEGNMNEEDTFSNPNNNNNNINFENKKINHPIKKIYFDLKNIYIILLPIILSLLFYIFLKFN